ncbi:hypothetical protein BH23CYA1_BH23CYA1_09590 [soil metagenome]
MQDNGTHNNSQAPQNGDRTNDNVVSFPSNGDTQLRDISTLLQGAPVIQQEQPVSKPGSEIATAEDFSQVEERRPFARKIGPKALLSMGLSLLVIFPIAGVFRGGGDGDSNSEQTAEVSEASSEEGGVYISAEDYAAQQAEIEQLRSQQAFIDQQVDAEAIDAAGRQRQQQSRANAQQAQPARRTASTASRPAQTTARPSTVAVRPAPTPSRATAAAPSRLAPVATAMRFSAGKASPTPAPVAQQPSAQASARAPEPVNPFERRAQLQALGSYGSPPPRTKAVTAQPASYGQANPFETPYIQTIALETPQARPALLTSSTQATAPVERPLTEEELQYQQDTAAVLSPPEAEDSVAAVPDPDESEAVEKEPPVTAQPTAIMPGTSTEAELPHGFSWQAGAPLPEVVLSTTEDILAGEQVAIPAGSQLLGQAQIDPDSGVVAIQIVGMFGEASIQIPRSSVIVQAEDGSVLMASASGGASRTAGPNVGGFFMESLGNGLGNVIDSGDNLAIDVAGGVAETLIDNQVERSEANASARASRASSRPIVWTLDAGPVRLTFNNYIPLANARL